MFLLRLYVSSTTINFLPEKCWPSSNWLVTRTCQRIRVSLLSNASEIMSDLRINAKVFDSRSRVKPASQPKYSSKAMLPLLGGCRSQSFLSFHNCNVRESEKNRIYIYWILYMKTTFWKNAKPISNRLHMYY